MTDKQIIIDENICEYYSDTKEDEEGANPIVGWCNDNYCKCKDIPLDECLIKAIQYCKLKDKQLKCKEQECEELKAKCNIYTCGICGNKEDCNKLYKTLTEIKEIARVNSINTCWTAINLCADCDEIEECGLQSPFEKLKAIIQKISECEGVE